MDLSGFDIRGLARVEIKAWSLGGERGARSTVEWCALELSFTDRPSNRIRVEWGDEGPAPGTLEATIHLLNQKLTEDA